MDGQEGLDFVFKLSSICLRSIGAWPEDYHSAPARIFTVFQYFASLLVLIVFVNFMQTVQLILFWGNLDVMTNVLSTADLPIANVSCMMIKFWWKRQVLKDLIAMVRKDWMREKTDRERELMGKSAIITRTLTTICVYFGQGACLSYLVLHIYLQFSLDLNFRLLYLNAYIPYDSQPSPNYELTWILQCMSTFISTAGFIGYESFFVIVVLHICGQLHCLRERLEELKAIPSDELDRKELVDYLRKEVGSIVQRHNYLYRITCDIEEIFSSVNLVQLFNFTIIFCLLGFRVVTMLSDRDGTILEAVFVVGFFTYLSSNLFICCYVAEQLRTESMAVEFAAYNSHWYDMKPHEARMLILVIMRGARPFQVTAGKFFNFNLDTFSSLMKTSASYMSVLIAMKNTEEE